MFYEMRYLLLTWPWAVFSLLSFQPFLKEIDLSGNGQVQGLNYAFGFVFPSYSAPKVGAARVSFPRW